MSDAESMSLHREIIPALPSLDDLRVFLAVARSGSFRAAAKELYVSQPTLSRAVARLEHDLGAQLVERGPRGVVVTASGQLLLTEARRILDQVAALRAEILAPERRTLRIGATATNARRYLAPYLRQWIPQHPDITTTAIAGNDESLRNRLENGDCDAVIMSAKAQGRFRTIHLDEVAVHAVFPQHHRLADSTDPVSVTELANEPLLVNGAGFPSHDLLHRAMEISGVQPRIAFECSVGLTLAAAAEAGMGVAIFGTSSAVANFKVVSRPLHQAGGDPLRFDLFVTWPEGAPDFTTEFCVGLATYHRTNRPA